MAGVTGKGGMWREKPPNAESAVGAAFPESAAERPHLSGATYEPDSAWLFSHKDQADNELVLSTRCWLASRNTILFRLTKVT
jgi:hypothetical protein